jgi:hypothetical protein
MELLIAAVNAALVAAVGLSASMDAMRSDLTQVALAVWVPRRVEDQ